MLTLQWAATSTTGLFRTLPCESYLTDASAICCCLSQPLKQLFVLMLMQQPVELVLFMMLHKRWYVTC